MLNGGDLGIKYEDRKMRKSPKCCTVSWSKKFLTMFRFKKKLFFLLVFSV